jgi:glycerate kinase
MVLGGERRHTTVTGPLGDPVTAEWLFVDRPSGAVSDLAALVPGWGRQTGPLAAIEASRAVGRSLVPHPSGDDPLRATTHGIGELLLAAVAAGARRIVVGVGGTAGTDGGLGAVHAVGPAERLDGAQVAVACDVTTRFRDAARVFGPQKGATAEQVVLLSGRLDELADRYRREHGVDVDSLAGSGAAGGLAGGLAVLGASLHPGVELVAAAVGLRRRMVGADAVVTGEGRLDATSFQGKVVGGVADLCHGRLPLWCVVGEVDAALPPTALPAALQGRVLSLVEAFGWTRATTQAAAAAADLLVDRLRREDGAGTPDR